MINRLAGLPERVTSRLQSTWTITQQQSLGDGFHTYIFYRPSLWLVKLDEVLGITSLNDHSLPNEALFFFHHFRALYNVFARIDVVHGIVGLSWRRWFGIATRALRKCNTVRNTAPLSAKPNIRESSACIRAFIKPIYFNKLDYIYYSSSFIRPYTIVAAWSCRIIMLLIR